MLGLLLVLLLLVVLFGGLGIFVAKVFLLAMVLMLVLGMLGGVRFMHRS